MPETIRASIIQYKKAIDLCLDTIKRDMIGMKNAAKVEDFVNAKWFVDMAEKEAVKVLKTCGQLSDYLGTEERHQVDLPSLGPLGQTTEESNGN
jgi:hypothetical protein